MVEAVSRVGRNGVASAFARAGSTSSTSAASGDSVALSLRNSEPSLLKQAANWMINSKASSTGIGTALVWGSTLAASLAMGGTPALGAVASVIAGTFYLIGSGLRSYAAAYE